MRTPRCTFQTCLQQLRRSQRTGLGPEDGGQLNTVSRTSTHVERVHEGPHIVGDLLPLAFALHEDLFGVEDPRRPDLNFGRVGTIHLDRPGTGDYRLLERLAAAFQRSDRLNANALRQHLVQSLSEVALRTIPEL